MLKVQIFNRAGESEISGFSGFWKTKAERLHQENHWVGRAEDEL